MSDTLAIVGSAPRNGLPAFACRNGMVIAAWIIEFVLRDQRPDKIVSGGAEGIDTLADLGARKHHIDFKALTPAVRRWAGPGGFMERNVEIVDDCDRLLRICCAESRSYGSGWTADLASRLGRPVERLFIHRDGTVTRGNNRHTPSGCIDVGPDMGLFPQLQIGGTVT